MENRTQTGRQDTTQTEPAEVAIALTAIRHAWNGDKVGAARHLEHMADRLDVAGRNTSAKAVRNTLAALKEAKEPVHVTAQRAAVQATQAEQQQTAHEREAFKRWAECEYRNAETYSLRDYEHGLRAWLYRASIAPAANALLVAELLDALKAMLAVESQFDAAVAESQAHAAIAKAGGAATTPATPENPGPAGRWVGLPNFRVWQFVNDDGIVLAQVDLPLEGWWWYAEVFGQRLDGTYTTPGNAKLAAEAVLMARGEA